jgi:hypothetical protein
LEARGKRLAHSIRTGDRRIKRDLERGPIALFARRLLTPLVVIDVAVVSLTAEAAPAQTAATAE